MGIFIVGSGGHAKVVVQTLRAARAEIGACVDERPETWGKVVLRIPIQGPLAKVPGRSRLIVAIGDNATRAKIVNDCPSAIWVSAIHPDAVIGEETSIGLGTLVAAGTIIQPGTSIGGHCILNTGCSVDHDCQIGDFVHIAPGARLAGGVSVGNGAFIGMGACVTPGVTIGENAVIGAGAVVLENVAAGAKVGGVPARPLS